MRTKLAILFIIVFLIGAISTAVAINDQGLSWGVEVGDRINYRLRGENVNGVTPLVDIGMYAEVDEVHEITETMTSFSQIIGLEPTISTYLANDTPYWLGLTLALPIGNWSLVEDLILDYTSLTEEDITNTANTWGYIVTQDFSTHTYTTMMIHSKTDGVMNYYKVQWDYDDNSQDQLVEITREGYSPGFGGLGLDSNTILYISIGAGVVVILIVAIVVIRRR